MRTRWIPTVLVLAFGMACGSDKSDTASTTDTDENDDTDDTEDCEFFTWYADADGDGFGELETSEIACEAPDGYVEDAADCDDTNAEVHPEATEICNQIDDNCDGAIDEDLEETWYADADGDGFGDPDSADTTCEEAEGYVQDATDCDDTDADVYPGAEEVCNEIDDDCDDEIDEGVLSTWYNDADYDGYGDPDSGVEVCDQPSGYVDNGDDCDDTSAGTYPDVSEDLCDGEDNDCDGDIDEDSKAGWPLLSVDHRYETIWEVDVSSGSLSEYSVLNVVDEEIPTMDVREDGRAVVYDAYHNELTEIDVCAGDLNPIGETGADTVCGIAFGPSGLLYGMDNDNDELVLLSLTTGEATTLGPLGIDLGACGLAWDCRTDTVYGIDAASDELFTLELATGAATDFLSLGVDFISVGIEFDPTTGLLLGSTGSEFVEIDPASGATTTLGSIGVTSSHINDLAFHPTCP